MANSSSDLFRAVYPRNVAVTYLASRYPGGRLKDVAIVPTADYLDGHYAQQQHSLPKMSNTSRGAGASACSPHQRKRSLSCSPMSDDEDGELSQLTQLASKSRRHSRSTSSPFDEPNQRTSPLFDVAAFHGRRDVQTQNQQHTQQESWSSALAEVLDFYAHKSASVESSSNGGAPIGLTLMRIPVISNALHHLKLVCDFERHTDAELPRAFVRLSSSQCPIWTRVFPCALDQTHRTWCARFIVPPQVTLITLEINLDTTSLFTRNKCRIIIRASECGLAVVPGFVQLERNWQTATVPMATSFLSAGSLRPADDDDHGAGWSALHQIVPLVYVLRHPHVSWAASRLFQKQLANHGVRFHLIEDDRTDARISVDLCCAHPSACNRCFYRRSTVWAGLQARLKRMSSSTSSTQSTLEYSVASDTDSDNRLLLRRLACAVKHAIGMQANRALFMHDAMNFCDDWEEHVQTHLFAMPDTWSVLQLSRPESRNQTTTALTDVDELFTTSTSLTFEGSSMSCFALGSNDTIAHLSEQLLLDTSCLTALARLPGNFQWSPPLLLEPAGAAASSLLQPVPRMVQVRPLVLVLVSIDNASASTEDTRALVHAYQAQTCAAWRLMLVAGRDGTAVTETQLTSWIGTSETRVTARWVDHTTDVPAESERFLQEQRYLNPSVAPFVLLGRVGYVPLPTQIARLVDAARSLTDDTVLLHCGARFDPVKTCSPVGVLTHTRFGPTSLIASQRPSTVTRVLPHALSCQLPT